MNVYFPEQALARVHDQLRFVTGSGSKRLADDVAREIVEGNRYDRLNRRTALGTAVDPLKSPRRGKYKGKTGPPLAPDSAASRVVANFRAVPRRVGAAGYRISAGWEGVVSDRGFPFLPALSRTRPIFGISPRTRLAINAHVAAFKAKVKGGSR